MKLFEYKAFELSDMLRDGKISSAELTKSVLDRIDEVEPKIDAYLTLCGDSAMESAK